MQTASTTPDTNADPRSVSVIVPVHNSMPYLEECLASILAQTTPAFEIICIDDGSTDDSARFLDETARTHESIVVVHQPCAGVSAARNAGIERARGAFILFVDADDLAAPNLIEKALASATQHAAEMTIFGFDEFYSAQGAYVPREMCPSEELYGRAFSLADITLPSPYLITPNVWRILYKRAFIQTHDLAFHTDLATSEDLAFIYESLFVAQRIALVPERLYHYRRDGGATLTRKARGCAGFDALDYVRSFAEQRGVFESNLRHFCNIAVDVAEYATSTAVDAEEFDMLCRAFNERLFDLVKRHEELLDERYDFFYRNISQGAQAYLFALYRRQRDIAEDGRAQLAAERDALASSRADAERARQETADVRASKSYRIGNFFMRGPAAIKRLLKRPSA